MLSLKQIEDVCLGNDSSYRRCRYFSQDENDHTKFYCLKLCSKASEIDQEIAAYVTECQKTNKNPLDANFPLGDNCGGYPILRHIEQGYDV